MVLAVYSWASLSNSNSAACSMAAGNDIVEDSFSTVSFPESLRQNEDLSPEDVAWIDSCLIKDVEVDDTQWDSLKDALLDILSSQTELLESSTSTAGSFPRGTDIEMVAPPDEEEMSNVPRGSDDHLLVSNDVAATRIDDSEDMYDSNPSFTESPFLPTYKDEIEETKSLESESNLEVSETEPSSDDIFRVWDLNAPSEEGELVEQLNKAMAESQVESSPSTLEDTNVLEDLKVESFDDSTLSFDDLILGIADLSLDQKR